LAKCINAAAARSGEKKNLFTKLLRKLFPKNTVIPYISNQNITPIVGRSSELQTVSEHLEKGTNTLILGHHGVGKRLLLDSVKTNKKILTFDDTASVKKSLIYMLLYLCENDKEQVAALLFGNFDLSSQKMETHLSRQSIGYLCKQIKRIVKPKEYVLKIKQFDDINKQSLKVIDSLKDTFVILATATEISITKGSFFWNFEKIELKNLTRSQSIDLIHRLSYDMVIEDYEVYKSHIYQQTDGNPKAITEMIERYRREPTVLTQTIRSVVFSGAVREWDCSLLVVLFIAGVAVTRFMTGELEMPALRLIGGMAMILLIATRMFIAKTKRKFI
jgi:predicted mannosyl-3-phosphoglycerate phosphatase (HAD superfamily)